MHAQRCPVHAAGLPTCHSRGAVTSLSPQLAAAAGRQELRRHHAVASTVMSVSISPADVKRSSISGNISSDSWSTLGDDVFQPGGDCRPVVLFDGVCNLCNGGVNFVLRWESGPSLRFAALQSPAGRTLLQRAGRCPDDISSIVLVEHDHAYTKSAAVLRIGRHLIAPLPALAVLAELFPLGFRDVVYDLVANNRYNLLGKADTCRLADERCRDRFLAD